MELFGVARWPGCADFISCSYTCSHGTQPGVATLVVPESEIENAATYGNLTFSDGVNPPLVLRDCKLSDLQLQGVGSDGGRMFSLSILDRRWKWAFGSVSGSWNIRDDKGFVKDKVHRSREVRELAKDCLRAAGENEDGVGGLVEPPHEEDRPEINWVHANPMQALSELVEAFGCRVVFRPFRNDVVILPAGEGALLPQADYVSYTPALDLPEMPSKITVVGAEIAYTVALALEAVGAEPNGDIRPINDLSYKPAGGWGTCFPPYFQNVTIPAPAPALDVFLPGVKVAAMSRKEYQDLAQSCVYRWYRATVTPLDGKQKWSAPGLEGRDIDRIDLLQLLPGIVTTRRDPQGEMVVDPPRIVGVYNRGAANYTTNTAKDEICNEGCTVDAEHGIIKFNRAMFRLNVDAAIMPAQIAAGLLGGAIAPYKSGPAELVAIISVYVRDTTHFQFEHATRSRTIGPKGLTRERIIRRDELRYVQYVEYDPNSWKPRTVEDNSAEFDRAADYYIDAALRDYDVKGAGQKKYPGILPVDPDGALQQITWEVGGGNAPFTTVSRNSEHAYWLPSLSKQRGDAKTKVIVDLVGLPSARGLLMTGGGFILPRGGGT